MSPALVGVGGIGVTGKGSSGLKTMALGSCVSVLLHDPRTLMSGMDHVALPDSTVAPDRAKSMPGYFADTGIPILIDAMKRAGAVNDHKGWVCKLAGGANVADPNNAFQIGKRNALAIKKILWALGMGPLAEDLGGSFSRTVTLMPEQFSVKLSTPGRPDWNI